MNTFKRITTSIMLFLLFLSQFNFAQEKLVNQANDELIKCEVETVITMLQTIYKKHKQGKMSLEQAKTLSADIIRDLRYGKDGYFWVDTEDGVNVVLYGRKDVEGKNRIEAQDEKGNFYIKDLIYAAQNGGGYVEYWFTKRGESTAEAKRSYIQQFKPFNWVIGTGYYQN